MGAAAIIVPSVGMPAGRGIPLLADVADRQSRDGRPQRVIGRKHSVIPVPVFSRLRDEIGEPVQLTSGGRAIPGPCRLRAVAAKAKVWLDRRTEIGRAHV